MVDLSRNRYQQTASLNEDTTYTINPLALRLERQAAGERQVDYAKSLGLNELSSKHWESLSRTPDCPGAISLGRSAHLQNYRVSVPPVGDPEVRTSFASVWQGSPTNVVFTLKLIRLGDLDRYRSEYVEQSQRSSDKRQAGRPVSNKEPSTARRNAEDLQWIVDGSEFRRVADERKLSMAQMAVLLGCNVTTLRRWVSYDRVSQNPTLSALAMCMIHFGKYQGIYARDMISLAEYEHLKTTVRERFMQEAQRDGSAVTVSKASLQARQNKRRKTLAEQRGEEFDESSIEAADAPEGEVTTWTKKHVRVVMDRLLEEYKRDIGVPSVGLRASGKGDPNIEQVPTTIIQRRLKSDPYQHPEDDDRYYDPADEDPAYQAHQLRLRQEEEAEIRRIRSKKSSAELWAERRERIEDNEAYEERQQFYAIEHDAEEQASKWATNIMACIKKLKASDNNGKLTEYLVENLAAIDPSDLEGFLYDVMKNHLLAEQSAKLSGEPELDTTNLARPETLEDLIAVAEKKKRPAISKTVVSHDGGLVGRIKRA